MFTILPRKFVVFLIFLFALGSLGLWYVLSFSPPQNVQITDVTENSAVVVWNTVKPSTSNVYYSTKSLPIKLLPLSFMATSLTRSHEETVNHRVVLTNLKPNQTYYLVISNWFHFYTTQRATFTGINNGFWQRIPSVSLPTIKTSPSVILGSPKGDSRITSSVNDSGPAFAGASAGKQARMTIVTGIVTNKNLHPISNALMIAKTASGQAFSSLTDQKGNFSFNLNLSDKDNLVFFTAQNGVNQQKNIVVAREIIKQPVLIRLP